jgi:predicted transcriptional regulator
MKKEEVELYSWIVRGTQRTKILQVMGKPMTPTQIKKETRLALNNVSDILRLFVKHKIAKCLNEKEKLGRVYELTEKGKRIKKLIS